MFLLGVRLPMLLGKVRYSMLVDDQPSLSRPAILAVDDQLLQLRIVTALLSKQYHVYTAVSGIEALRFLEEMSIAKLIHCLSIILLDVTMPELNGLAVMELIRARYPQIPVIICSAHKERSVILDAKQRGANDYLLKPFTSEVLFQKLRQHTPPHFYG